MLAFLRRYPGLGTLILANLLPVLGILFAGWRTFDLLFFYWLETVVIGVVNIAKLIAVNDGSESLGLRIFHRVVGVPFFIVHFGGFTFFHGLCVMGVGAAMSPGSGRDIGQFIRDSFNLWTWLIAAGLLISHGHSFIVNFLSRGEYRRTDFEKVMTQPYGRIAIMHLTVILGAVIAMALGDMAGMALFLIALKVPVDIWAHIREHRKLQAAEKGSS